MSPWRLHVINIEINFCTRSVLNIKKKKLLNFIITNYIFLPRENNASVPRAWMLLVFCFLFLLLF